MSKIIISREYELPDEIEEMEIDCAAQKLYRALYEIKQQVRQIWKYEDDCSEETIDRIYETICSECAMTGVEI